MSDTNENLPQPSSSSGDPVGFDFMRIYAALLKRLWLIVLVFVVVLGAVSFWTFRQVPIYRAETTIVIDLTPPQVLKGVSEVVELGSGSFWSTREYFETQYRILKSRALAEKVVARLGLDHDLAYLHIDPNLDPARRADALKNANPIGMVLGQISIVPAKDSRVAVVQIEDTNPQRAADLANAVADEYIEQNVDRKLAATLNASAWLSERIGIEKKKLEDSEKKLHQFKVDHDVLSTSLEDRKNISGDKVVQTSDALTKTGLRRLELEARRQTLKQLLEEQQAGVEFKAESFRPVADSPLISELKREYFRLQSEKAEISEKYLADHPKRQAIEERIIKVRADIHHAIQVVLDMVEAEYRQILDEEKRLRGFLEEGKQEALKVNNLEVDYNQLRRERDQNASVYDLMVKRQKEVGVAGMLRTNNIRLLDPALVPKAPIRPNRPFNIMLGMVIGLVFGIGLVLLLEVLDNTVKSQEDVEQGLGLPLLGILPSIPSLNAERVGPESLRKRDLYVGESPTSAVSECARSIRTSLLFSSPDRPFKVLLIASTGPREGKTTTAISIGITMAQSGNRVLLVDGDLRRPRLHRTFGVPSSVGLSTMILGESKLEDTVKQTGIEGLFLLPAGPVPPNPAELLHSERCADVIKFLSEHYDRVIIDSAPLGVVTDALVMSKRADGIVLVLRSGVTPKKVAYRGRKALQDVKAHVYGAVLNDVDLGSRAGQYYYYYYRYGYYPSEPQEVAAAAAAAAAGGASKS